MRAAERELDRLDGSGPGAVVRSAQIMQAVTAISHALSDLWLAMGDLVRAGQQDARTEALRQSFRLDKTLLYLEVPEGKRAAMLNNLLESSRFNVEAALARVYISRIPLAEKVYRTAELTRGWVESRVTKAIARGATPAELAKEVRRFINPATPGGASYAAKRLARTEINNAYHAVIAVHNEDKPWVTNIKWNLSGSHPTTDICDVYAKKNGGLFPKDKVPRKPHPQCLCYIVPVVIDDELFIKRWRSGAYNEYVARTYE
jgi:predicted nucleic acid-binding protein